MAETTNNDDLKLKLEQLIDEAYQRGNEDAWKRIVDVRSKDIECGYNRGINDTWECGRRITNETSVVLSKIFGEVDASAVFQRYTPQEAMQKIKNYERKQKWSEQAKCGKEHRDEIEKMLKGKLANQCDKCEYKGLGGCTRQAKGYSDLCIDFNKYKPKQNEDDYVDAIVKVRVPKWQIGEKVNLYFKDTMSMDGVCEADKKQLLFYL